MLHSAILNYANNYLFSHAQTTLPHESTKMCNFCRFESHILNPNVTKFIFYFPHLGVLYCPCNSAGGYSHKRHQGCMPSWKWTIPAGPQLWRTQKNPKGNNSSLLEAANQIWWDDESGSVIQEKTVWHVIVFKKRRDLRQKKQY